MWGDTFSLLCEKIFNQAMPQTFPSVPGNRHPKRGCFLNRVTYRVAMKLIPFGDDGSVGGIGDVGSTDY